MIMILLNYTGYTVGESEEILHTICRLLYTDTGGTESLLLQSHHNVFNFIPLI